MKSYCFLTHSAPGSFVMEVVKRRLDRLNEDLQREAELAKDQSFPFRYGHMPNPAEEKESSRASRSVRDFFKKCLTQMRRHYLCENHPGVPAQFV